MAHDALSAHSRDERGVCDVVSSGNSSAVWPWLAQMGAGSRAGWYSYDVLDNRRRSSATRIIPALPAPLLSPKPTRGLAFSTRSGFRVYSSSPSRQEQRRPFNWRCVTQTRLGVGIDRPRCGGVVSEPAIAPPRARCWMLFIDSISRCGSPFD
jgi:hypothetical protein